MLLKYGTTNYVFTTVRLVGCKNVVIYREHFHANKRPRSEVSEITAKLGALSVLLFLLLGHIFPRLFVLLNALHLHTHPPGEFSTHAERWCNIYKLLT